MRRFNSKKLVCLGLSLAGFVLLADSAQADLFQRWRNRRMMRNNSYYYQSAPQSSRRVVQPQSVHPIEYRYGVESSPRRDHESANPGSHHETHRRLQQGYGMETSPDRSPGHYGGAVQIDSQNRPVFHRGYSQETTPQR